MSNVVCTKCNSHHPPCLRFYEILLQLTKQEASQRFNHGILLPKTNTCYEHVAGGLYPIVSIPNKGLWLDIPLEDVFFYDPQSCLVNGMVSYWVYNIIQLKGDINPIALSY